MSSFAREDSQQLFGGGAEQLATVQLRAQHGIYSSISSVGSGGPSAALSAAQAEAQTLEKSISLTAAAPPLRLAPPFPGPCPATAHLGPTARGAHVADPHGGGAAAAAAAAAGGQQQAGWKDSDPSKTHAVIVALCLGRQAWEFQSDDAPVQLVNGGAPPLLAVAPDEGDDAEADNKARRANKLLGGANIGGADGGGAGGGGVIAFHIEKSRAAQQQQQQQQQAQLLPGGGVAAGTAANPIGGGADNHHLRHNHAPHAAAAAAAAAAANHNRQPTITPPGAPSTLYSWRALRAHSDIATKSCARAGEGIEALYKEMVRGPKPGAPATKVVTPLINPTTEHIRDVLHKGATDAADEQHRRNLQRSSRDLTPAYTGPNKLLLHYVGHGVPRPERGCLYFSRQSTQRQHHAFTPVRDILHLLGTPCMLLCDCASAGNVRSALVAVERELNPYSAQKENRFFWGACADGEPLPQHPLMPDDLFTSIMLSPVRMAVLFFIVQHKGLYDFPPYLVHCFANEWGGPAQGVKAGSAVAEVRNAFNAIVESIAAKVLAPDVFTVCFRQDTVVLNLFRGFVLAQRIIGWLGQEPCSHPHVPPDTAQHPLWQSFDFVVEGVLGSILRAWRPKPVYGLSVHAFRMSLDPTLVLKNMPEPPPVRPTTFFYDSLVSLQGMFDSAQAQALVAGSLVDPPGKGDHGHRDPALAAAAQQLLRGSSNGGGGAGVQGPQVDLLTHSIETWSQMGGSGSGSSAGGGPLSESDRPSTLDGSSSNTVDFASYLLLRGANGGGSAMARLLLPGADDFANNKELVSFVGTRFPILQHAFVSRDTRFFAMMILARWLDLGSIAVECCELFGLYREILLQVWQLKAVDDQDAPMVMIAAKTCIVDPRHLLVQRSLQVPASYCARVFNGPAEPSTREVAHRLGILGQPATQRWFAVAAIAMMLLREPQLATSVLVTAQPSGGFACPSSATCMQILDTPIPARRATAPDSDTEPSIASNLKAACVGLLGTLVYSLRDAGGPLLTAFLLPALRDAWIESVAALLSHRDSTPRIRWGCARALHIFLAVLQRLATNARNNNADVPTAAPPPPAGGDATAAALPLTVSELCAALSVRIVARLVQHAATLEGNVDVRREVLGALAAFASSLPDVMLSAAVQGEMRAQFTGQPSPNRGHQLPSLYASFMQQQWAQQAQRQSAAAAASLVPPGLRHSGSREDLFFHANAGNNNNAQLLGGNNAVTSNRRSHSDLLNISQASLTPDNNHTHTTERLNNMATPALSVINSPHRLGGGGVSGADSGYPSRLDFPAAAVGSGVHSRGMTGQLESAPMTFVDVSADTTFIGGGGGAGGGVGTNANFLDTSADSTQMFDGDGPARQLDARTQAMLHCVKWILSLRHDAHPVMRVLCIRALQRFVAERFVTLALFTKPQTRGAPQPHQQQQSGLASGFAPVDSTLSARGGGAQQQQQQQQQPAKKTMMDRFASIFSSGDAGGGSTANPAGQRQGRNISSSTARGFGGNRPSGFDSHQHSHHAQGGGGGADDSSELDRLLFSESDAALLFDFDAPAVPVLDLDGPAAADVTEFLHEMLRALTKPVVPRICQRVSLGDLPPRLARPQTTAAAIAAACSAPLVGDVAPHRCVFHSFLRHTMAKVKTAKHDSALSDIVSRHVYAGVDASHIAFHPTEHFAVCCSADDVLSVVSTAPRDKRVLLQQRIESILPNGVDEAALFPPSSPSGFHNGSALGGGGGGDSDGDVRTPSLHGSQSARLGGGLEAASALRAGARTRTTALVLLDAVHSHTAAVVSNTGCVRLVTDVASRAGVRLATAFPGVSSTIEYQSANATIHGGGGAAPVSSPRGAAAPGAGFAAASGVTCSVAAYQPLGQRLIVTGESCRYALWDLGQQRKLDERAVVLPASDGLGRGVTASNSNSNMSITCATALAASPECFCLGLTRCIVVTDHRMRDGTAGLLHIPDAFGGAGCAAIASHPTAPTKITGLSYAGLICVWDMRYAMDVGDARAVLPGFGAHQQQQLRPGMSRAALPRAAYLPGMVGGGSKGGDDPSSPAIAATRVSTAAIHPLFSDAPLIAAGVGNKFRVMLPEQVLASRNDQPPVVCAWHPYEIVGAVVPWTADVAQRRLEIFSAAAASQRADHIVDLIL